MYVCLRGLWWSTRPTLYMQRPGVDVGCLITHHLPCFFETQSVTDWLDYLNSNPQVPTHRCLSALGLQAQTVTPIFLYWFGIRTHIPMPMHQYLIHWAISWCFDPHGHIQAQAYDIKHMNIIVTHLSVHIPRSACLQFTHSATYICRYIETQVNVYTH